MFSKSKSLALLCAAAGVASAAAVAQAQTSIAIVNPDFNQVLESAGSTVTGTIPTNSYSSGWGTTTFSSPVSYSDGTSSTAGYAPGWSSPGSSGEENLLAAGTRVAGDYGYAQSTALQQGLTATVTPGATYLLSAGADVRFGTEGIYMNLLANGAPMLGVYSGGPAGAQQAPSPIYEVVTAPANATGPLGIQLGDIPGASAQAIYNNVSLIQDPTSNIPPIVNNAFAATNLGTAPPTPGLLDQSNMAPTGTVGTTTNPNYYTNNAGSSPGETFTTGALPTYNLNSITVLDASEHGGFKGGTTLTLGLYSMAGNVPTAMDVLNAVIPVGTGAASGDFIQLALGSPILLKGNTVYGYSLLNNNGYSGLGVDSANDYTGGQLGMFGNGALTAYPGSPNAIFDVGLSAGPVPEPASLGILAFGGLATLLLVRRNKARV